MTIGYLHGLLGTPPGTPILAALDDAGLTPTALHLPGFSGTPPSPQTRTMADWVFTLSASVDEAGLAGQPLLASSVGAMVALELAAVRPEAFSHLVLISPLGLWDDTDPVTDLFAATLSGQRRLLTADPTATALFFDDPPEPDPAVDPIEAGVARYQTRTAAASLVWPLPDHGLAQRIHRVTTPVSLVWGTEDALNPISYLDRYAAALPNLAATHRIESAGHLAHWDQPATVAKIAVADCT